MEIHLHSLYEHHAMPRRARSLSSSEAATLKRA
jgi:hypothetical protein